jgi:phosphatidylserine/phosphatidylglycerophosphate/cardiolipin synthase-like enzyme
MRRTTLLVPVLFALGGCALDAEPLDGPDDIGVAPGGKADGSDYTACELDGVVRWLNAGTSVDALIAGGVHSRTARNLVAHRDGADAVFATGDDDLFDDIGEVDGVSYVGPVAISRLVSNVEASCAAGRTEVIFSPQPYEQSHLVRVRELIDGADGSIDIAMYSFRDAAINDALARAVARGVSIRMIYDGASADRTAPEGTTSARLEAMGIEVRWVNKVMHHKLAIIDGRGDGSEAVVVTGSGNWSNSAATRFDENTVVIHSNAELAQRYQAEYEHLWANSRELVWNESIEHVPTSSVAITADDPSVDALFTSANFTTSVSTRYGATFSVVPGRNVVADRWVALILGARRSIRIASGHLRSRPVAEALLEAQRRNPELDIRVYLDGQEYLAAGTHEIQERELAECIEAAGSSVSRQQACLDRGFLFSYQLHEAGIPLRYKYYAYRWDHSYADQMHHKYMVVDEEILVTGSYNLSDNAEHATMENVVVFQGEPHRALVDAFIDNFDAIWVTGEEDGLYDTFLASLGTTTGDIPIVFAPMALDWAQVTALKRAIRSACPAVDSTEYREHPETHRYCAR